MSESSYSSSYTDFSNENIDDYKLGGYAPISIGELLNNRYRIVKKLGFGVFSIVYLSYDYENNDFYALKISKSSKDDIEIAEDELSILKEIKSKYCCRLLNYFNYETIFGIHMVLVFPLYGETLFNIIREYRYNGLSYDLVKKVSISILESLDYIHNKLHIINTDIKPENILVSKPNKFVRTIIKNYKIPSISQGIRLLDRHFKTMTKSQLKRYKKLKRKKVDNEIEEVSDDDEIEYKERISSVVLSDFGNACYTNKHYSDKICTRHYKPPENILSNDYDTSADIWSFGCCIYESLTGDVLFNPELFDEGDKRELNDTHLASMIEITGGDALIYKDGEDFNEYCRDDGSLRFIKNLRNISLYKKLLYNTDMKKIECKQWSDFILYILEFDYKKRPSARQILDKYKEWLNTY